MYKNNYSFTRKLAVQKADPVPVFFILVAYTNFCDYKNKDSPKNIRTKLTFTWAKVIVGFWRRYAWWLILNTDDGLCVNEG